MIPTSKPAQIGEALPTLQGVAGNTEGKIANLAFPVTTQGVRPLDGFRHIITMMISITRRPWYLLSQSKRKYSGSEILSSLTTR